MDILIPGFGLIFILLLGLASLALIVIAVISLLKNDRMDSGMKIFWLLFIIFMPMLGAIFYLVLGRNSGSGKAR